MHEKACGGEAGVRILLAQAGGTEESIDSDLVTGSLFTLTLLFTLSPSLHPHVFVGGCKATLNINSACTVILFNLSAH